LKNLCWNGTCVDNCDQPLFTAKIPTDSFNATVPGLTVQSPISYFIYRDSPQTKSDIVGLLLLLNSNTSEQVTVIDIESPTYNDLNAQKVGPYPTWNQWTAPGFFLSPIVKISSPVLDSPSQSNRTLGIIFAVNNFTKIGIQFPKYCLGIISDWYWTNLDNNTLSPFANLDIFKNYSKNYSDTTIKTPKSRWKCLYNAIPLIPEGSPYSAFIGAYVDYWGTYAIIANPDAPTPPPPPSDDTSPQIGIIIGSIVIFVGITITMIVLHVTDDNSPSLKCWK
jgi:hypothetical protein